MPDNELIKALSDFIKGKDRGALGQIAKVSWQGTEPPEPTDFDPYPPFRRIASEHPLVMRGIAKCGRFLTAASIGGLLTLPELQSNSIRLQALAHLSLIAGRNKGVGATGAQVGAWFGQLESGICGSLEDPAEDLFVSNVSDQSGNYRLFEGTGEATAFQVQMILSILDKMPAEGTYSYVRRSVAALLKLSEAIANRSELQRNTAGEPYPVAAIGKLGDALLRQIRNRVMFDATDLRNLDIELESLSPFIFDDSAAAQLSERTFGESELFASPIVAAETHLAVVLPNAIGLSIQRYLVEYCLASKLKEPFERALALAHQHLLEGERLLGLPPPRLQIARIAGYRIAETAIEVDGGRFVHFIFFFDNLDSYQDTKFIGTSDASSLSKYISESVERIEKQFSSGNSFREGLTLVAGGGWGRPISVGLPAGNRSWHVIPFSISDLVTLGRKPKFEALDLFRVLDALGAADREGFSIVYANGFLNLYSWMDENKGHIVPHERLDDDFASPSQPGKLLIPQNSLRRLRLHVADAFDLHRVTNPEGVFVRAVRYNENPPTGSDNLLPFYVSLDGLAARKVQAVYEHNEESIWVQVDGPNMGHEDTLHHLQMMVLHWAEHVAASICRDERAQPVSLVWNVVFQDDQPPDGKEPIPSSAAASQFVHYDIEWATRTAEIVIGKGFLHACRRPDNIAETSIVRALSLSASDISGSRVPRSLANEIVQKVATTDGARHFHAFIASDVRDVVRDGLPRPLKIKRLDDAYLRLGLGWLARDRSLGPNITGKEHCCPFLNNVVKAVIAQIKTQIGLYGREELITVLLRNHEALAIEDERWKRTFRSVRALSDSPEAAVRSASEDLWKLNASSLASRIIIEMALCCSPLVGKIKPSTFELHRLLGAASLIFHMGGYSDAISFDAMTPRIRISPAGDVLMDHSFTDKTVQPFGELFQAASLDDAAANFATYYDVAEEDEEHGEISVEDRPTLPDFETAWRDEFGFELEDLKKIVEGFKDLAGERRTAVLSMRRSELLTFLQDRTSLEPETISKTIECFSLRSRAIWEEPPAGFLPNAWHPWRFRRQLSIVSRPIVLLDEVVDPTLIVAPAMITHHLTKFVADALFGRFDEAFFRKSGAMQKWIGRTNDEAGNQFNEKVAGELVKFGWLAKANLTDGEILARKKDPKFGDVDVLAWKPESGRVIVIECKDLSLDKTFGEIARRLSKYRGDVKGERRDDLRKHLDRVEEIRKNSEALSKYLGCNVSSIECALIFNRPTHLQFFERVRDLGVMTFSFRDLEDLH